MLRAQAIKQLSLGLKSSMPFVPLSWAQISPQLEDLDRDGLTEIRVECTVDDAAATVPPNSFDVDAIVDRQPNELQGFVVVVLHSGCFCPRPARLYGIPVDVPHARIHFYRLCSHVYSAKTDESLARQALPPSLLFWLMPALTSPRPSAGKEEKRWDKPPQGRWFSAPRGATPAP